LGAVAACGGGGGNSAAGVNPGPPAPGGPVEPPTPEFPNTNPAPYAEAAALFAFITDARINDSQQPVVSFQLTDGNNVPITDLAAENVRFVIAKLQRSPLGNLTGNWQSYINRIEQPGVGPGTQARLQATSESSGELQHSGGGRYLYTFATRLTDLPADVRAQANTEDIDLDFDPTLTHRVAIQFDGSRDTANPHYDWVPESGATQGIFSLDIAATESCNRCHDPLAIHGGNRREIAYCVTCHNTGTTDANSGNNLDMKVMVHKIHRGAALPSVLAGGEYAIYGFRDSKHDYSTLRYPQDIRNCVNCHAGTATGSGIDEHLLTAQGDNWAEYATAAVCGSCHDDVDFATHKGGQPDDTRCSQCHGPDKNFSIVNSHRMLIDEARKQFRAEILSVENSAPGERPVVGFRVSNPLTGEPYDILNDPVFAAAGATLRVGMAWNTADYTNTGNGSDNANAVATDALANATGNGDGSYSLGLASPVPDGSGPPGEAASGSGVVTIEGHPVLDTDGDGQTENVPVGDVVRFFSIDEADGTPMARRQVVEIERCLACHGSLVLHGSNRADNIDSCVTCHNPRNTDRGVREIAQNPPTDGKQEESLDFKTMIHAIHAASIREQPLQVVGFRGFTTYVYDEEQVHYPGDLANCVACHGEQGYSLPLAESVLATSIDTGEDRQDPADDRVTSPATAVCSSCHDDTVAAAHMTANGGSFSTTQQAIDSGEVVEQCALCHGEGRSADTAQVHDIR
tara:strand:- start:30188 stop:32416 length:2229 start_codon:yes stop_codon:yes gene_type:complete